MSWLLTYLTDRLGEASVLVKVEVDQLVGLQCIAQQHAEDGVVGNAVLSFA